jgi:hypothetical protein
MEKRQSGMTFDELNNYFKQNEFPSIEKDPQGYRFLLLRSMSRNDLMEKLMKDNNIVFSSKKEYLKLLFDSHISEQEIINFINENYQSERKIRRQDEPVLIDQLQRLQTFNWGGSYQNGLEKNIVDNYVKKIKNFDELNRKIDSSILDSVRGYTLCSWYNHWTSIIIEDLLKDQSSVLPAIGLVTKIDFFINRIPFDLKVTYFPEELMATELKDSGFGNEITQLKRQCRKLNLLIPEDLGAKSLCVHLYNKLKENSSEEAKNFIIKLNSAKRKIINKYKADPSKLKIWFYEHQGEKRFDASNRFFLVLIDEDNTHESWKLKRKVEFLRQNVDKYFSTNNVKNLKSLITPFSWIDGRQYEPYSDILFLSYTN